MGRRATTPASSRRIPRLLSRIYLAHVRHKTVGGEPSHADTHPFARELGGRDYCFAHNGTLDGPAWDLPLGRYRPIGETDSERFFCHLLGEVAARGGRSTPRPTGAGSTRRWPSANRFGKLNVLLSDGHRLFVYHDVNGWKGLNFRKVRVRDGQPRHFGDDTMAVDLDGGRRPTTASWSRPARSARLGWHSFRLGELIVFDRGEIRFSSHRERRSAEFATAEPARRPEPGRRPALVTASPRLPLHRRIVGLRR